MHATVVHITDSCRLPCLGEASQTSMHWVKDSLLENVARTLKQQSRTFAGNASKILAEKHAKLLRSNMYIPQASTSRPSVLSNTHVLKTAQSLPFILHPTLPMCIMGYGQSVSEA